VDKGTPRDTLSMEKDSSEGEEMDTDPPCTLMNTGGGKKTSP
jgi:hypothetical protein